MSSAPPLPLPPADRRGDITLPLLKREEGISRRRTGSSATTARLQIPPPLPPARQTMSGEERGMAEGELPHPPLPLHPPTLPAPSPDDPAAITR